MDPGESEAISLLLASVGPLDNGFVAGVGDECPENVSACFVYLFVSFVEAVTRDFCGVSIGVDDVFGSQNLSERDPVWLEQALRPTISLCQNPDPIPAELTDEEFLNKIHLVGDELYLVHHRPKWYLLVVVALE